MFTGLVEAIGRVTRIVDHDGLRELQISAPNVMSDLQIDHSIAVNGVCLTVVAIQENGFTVEAVPETLTKTNLGQLAEGDAINLERSMLPTQRLGGHFVQGHVDGVVEIISIEDQGQAQLLSFKAPHHLSRYIVDKGYVALDGMSLTVIEASSERFNITLIPHTLKVTIAGQYQVGQFVNLEVDIMAKYLERLQQSDGEKR